VDAADAHINADGIQCLRDDLRVKAVPALSVAVDVTITAEADAIAADRAQLAVDVEDLLRAAFRESAAY
jgi:hypothetical protein